MINKNIKSVVVINKYKNNKCYQMKNTVNIEYTNIIFKL